MAINSLEPKTSTVFTLDEAYALCKRFTKSHRENFALGSWFTPKQRSKHLFALYTFCRSIDDLGDEFVGDRMDAIQYWEDELLRCYAGSPRHPYMLALQRTIETFDIPREPFLKLVKANRTDQTKSRYATYEQLTDYCKHSANPVGRLVLYVCGYRDTIRQNLADHICTALQLANFWQDVVPDYAKGRVYIPREDMERFGCEEGDIGSGRTTDGFRRLIAFQVQRTRELFKIGSGLVDKLDKDLRFDVGLFHMAGLKILDTIEEQRYDVLSRRPKLSRFAKLNLIFHAFVKLKVLDR